MRIAVFGGSFNPVHNGHLKLAEAVRELAGYDRILFVPAYHSPFKALPSGATDDDRVRMLEIALAGKEWAVIEKCELSRGGMSYTYDTIEYLEQKYTASGELDVKRDGKLGLVIGADLVAGFANWYRASELASKVDIILARRTVTETSANSAGFCAEEANPADIAPHETLAVTEARHETLAAPHETSEISGFPFSHTVIENPYIDVSSSEVRQAVHDGKKLKALVPKSVCDYILERRLYD